MCPPPALSLRGWLLACRPGQTKAGAFFRLVLVWFLYPGTAMDDSRHDQRLRTLKSGTISTESAGSFDCLIRNTSKTGACLEVEHPSAIPDEFRLVIKPDNVFRTCKVVWREDGRIG